jgi:hypothetical protein
LCINTALTAITHTTTGATGIGTATGLPAGVTAAWASNVITISGTPSVSGTFSYTIPLTGGCGLVSATGTITVTPNNTVGTASSTPSVCINTPLTDITHATTGATGIGTATGLPAGVTAAWASNTITISGTPTASGTFNYSIPLTGGCGSVNATGTITVKALPVVTADNVSGCSGSSITLSGSGTPIGGTGVYSPTSPFVGTSSTTYTYTYTAPNGCSASATANITITPQPTWYMDADGDHYYSTTTTSCTNPGAGYTQTGLLGAGDCDDTVVGQSGVPGANIHPGATEVCYNNVDDNCSGVKSEGCAPVPVYITNQASITSFSNSLSCVPYTYPGTSNIAYRIEIERFANGVSAGAPVTLPTQSSRFFYIPNSLRVYTTTSTVTTYKIRASAVINGEVVDYFVPTVTISSYAIPTVQLTSCPTALTTIASTISANPGFNATDYSFRIRLNNTSTYYYNNNSASRFISSNSFSGLQLQYGMTYKVSVNYHILNNGILEESGWGAECDMTTPTIPVVGLASPVCSSQVTSMGATMSAYPATYADRYKFRIRLTSNSTYYYTTELTSRFSQLGSFQGITLAYNTSYMISVQYRIPNNGDPVWSDFGAECEVITPFYPTVEIVCNPGSTTLTQSISFASYVGYPTYKVRLVELDQDNNELPLTTQYITRIYNYFTLSMFTTYPVVAGKSYNASVAIILNGIDTEYGRLCTITAAASTGRSVIGMKETFKASAYPNPFANNFMLDVKTSSESVVNVKVYDMIGRLIEQRDVPVSAVETTTIGERYPSGVYNVVVSQEDNVETVRVVKR